MPSASPEQFNSGVRSLNWQQQKTLVFPLFFSFHKGSGAVGRFSQLVKMFSSVIVPPSKASDSKFSSSSGRSIKYHLLKFANCQLIIIMLITIIIMLIKNAFNPTVDFKGGYMHCTDFSWHFSCFVAEWGKKQVGGI